MRAAFAIAGAIAVLVIAVPTGLDSCAYSLPTPVFATKQMPADLEGEFLKGRLGVLQRSYREQYLIGAFRILSGTPLTEEEVGTLFSDPPGGDSSDSYPAEDSWIGVRMNVPGLKELKRLETYKTLSTSGQQTSFLNCRANAFENASETLVTLSDSWGFDDPRTRQWVEAQDQVFNNCSATEPTIPAPPDDSLDPLLAKHRRYQIAAAYFYAGDLRKAAQGFQEIAADPDSPWKEIAPYLSARSLLRAGLLNGDMDSFREGKRQIQAILDDPNQSEWHEASSKLLQVWQLRAEPEQRLRELSSDLSKPRNENVQQSVIDFLYVLQRHPEFTESADSDELAAWVGSMKHSSLHPGQTSTNWWRKQRSPAWLLSALANAKREDAPELLLAAWKIQPASPAFDSVSYYAIRLAKTSGDLVAARRFANRALGQKLSLSSRNWILAERLELARDWPAFLRSALRRPEQKVVDEDGKEFELKQPVPPQSLPVFGPVFDTDVRHVFDFHLPLELWVEASRNPALPAPVQLAIAQSGWVRAVTLDRTTEAQALLRRVVELQPGAAAIAKNYLDARSPDEARFAAVYLSLWTPTLVPHLPDFFSQLPQLTSPRAPYADQSGRSATWLYRYDNNRKVNHDMHSGFLTAEQHLAGERETSQILAAPPWAANYVLMETIAWAGAHPDDPRVPRALHMAVLASRYRFDDKETGKLSKQAFDLLHKRYPKSEWTAKTKYWYGSRG